LARLSVSDLEEPMAITLDHIHVEDVQLQGAAKDGYARVTFRVLDKDHPNTFVVPVLVNTSQIDPSALTNHARYVFHHLMRTLSETTRTWEALDRPGART
jgi:hypothetical protein